MPLPPSLQKSIPPLGKFGIWLGIKALTNNLTNSPELTESLATAGVGLTNLDGACEVIKNLISDNLSDSFKEFLSNAFSKNHNLQHAFQKGIANALDELKTKFLAEHKHTLSGDEPQQIKLFFESLAYHLKNELTTDAQINEYVQDRPAFFDNLIKTVHTLPGSGERAALDTVLLPELSVSTASQLAEYLVAQFEPTAQRSINEEFKTDDKSRTAYFIHLLEYSAKLSHDNNDLLEKVSQSLDDIGRQQQQHTDLLRQVAQAQQPIYDKLQKLNTGFKAFVSEFDQFKDRINTRLEPSLRLNTNYNHLDESFSYQYGLRYTSFISRDEEMDQLWNFLNGQPDRRMLWWLVTGPGGMGKSRLALELCLQARCVNRYVGFVESDQLSTFDWSQWRPDKPTLLVIDYVAAQAESTQKMIGQLSRSAQNGLLTQPVRVLLLEREIQVDRENRDDWWKSFSGDRDVAESSYVSGKPQEILALPAFSDADRWRIIEEVHQKEKVPLTADQRETIQSLAEIDPKGRPLFAFLAGMALAKGEDIRKWDVYDLLNNLLQREEREIWAKHPNWPDVRCREGHKNLLMLTTLTRGLTVTQLKELFKKAPAWLPDQKPDVSLYQRLSDIRKRILPNNTEENAYEGLQPDLVGEYYVLKRIEQLLGDDFTGESDVQALLQLAWNLSPEQTWWSIGRTVTDFNRFPEAHKYLENSRPLPHAPLVDWLNWSNLQVNLTTSYSKQRKMVKAEECYRELKTLAQAHPTNEGIILRQAIGAMNLTIAYSTQEEIIKAENYYKDLQILAQTYPHNEDIVLAQASGVINLTAHYGTQGDMEKAKERHKDLQMLAQIYPYSREIKLRQAKCILNLIATYGRQGEMSRAEECYKNLQKLAQDYPHNEYIVIEQAKGVFNLITSYGQQGQIAQAQAQYEDLKTLAQKYSHNQDIVLRQAMAAANLTVTYDTQKDIEKYYKDLQTIAQIYPHNKDIVRLLAELCHIKG